MFVVHPQNLVNAGQLVAVFMRVGLDQPAVYIRIEVEYVRPRQADRLLGLSYSDKNSLFYGVNPVSHQLYGLISPRPDDHFWLGTRDLRFTLLTLHCYLQ